MGTRKFSKAEKQRIEEFRARNKKLSAAIYHIQHRALMAYSKAGTVLNSARKELMAGEVEIAKQKYHRARELTDHIYHDLDIIARHLGIEPAVPSHLQQLTTLSNSGTITQTIGDKNHG